MADHAHDVAELIHNAGVLGLDARDLVDDPPMYRALERFLIDHGYDAKRDVHLTRIGRVELMVGSTAIVALTWGTPRQATSTVEKVAGSRHVTGVVLATTVAEHGLVPAVVKGTPVRTVVVA